MNIKVCGITDLKQMQELDAMGIDYVGLNFYSESPRYVVGRISGDEVKEGEFGIRKVGVFVNADADTILRFVDEYELDVVQLHGEESPLVCRQLSEHTEVIKVFRVNDEASNIEDAIAKYDDACDYYLFDTGGYLSPLAGSRETNPGGTGKQFDWNMLLGLRIEKPFFLAGGIGLPDVVKLNTFDHPDLFAVDINSRFEISPGIKDLEMVKMFAQVLKGG